MGPFGPCWPSAARQRDLMRVTMAHELFHLVQFGYDTTEDAWLMEGTATWIENEVFPHVNDNLGFLWARPSKMQTPAWPLDHPDTNWYGNWIFFRYLSERFGRVIIRQIWRRADAWLGYNGSRQPRDLHSVRAVRDTVQARTGNWSREYTRFHVWNRRPARYYSEARELGYPVMPRRGTYRLTRDLRQQIRSFEMDHLGGAVYRITPGNLNVNWNLRIRVDGMDRGHGFAIATTLRRDGTMRHVQLPLGANGTTTQTIPFGNDRVQWVEVTIVNASVRYRCWQGDRFNGGDHRTCKGTPTDDRVPHRLVTTAVRP